MKHVFFAREPLSGKLSLIWDSRLNVVVVLWLSFGLIDFYKRFGLFEEYDSVQLKELPSSETLTNVALGGPILQQYLEKLASFGADRLELQPSAEIELPSEAPLGNGYWEGGNYSFKLIGIFKGIEQFVVLEKRSNESGDRELVELSVGDDVGGYMIDVISEHALGARDGAGDRIELILFKRSLDDIQ